jgi:hypothetical protein
LHVRAVGGRREDEGGGRREEMKEPFRTHKQPYQSSDLKNNWLIG